MQTYFARPSSSTVKKYKFVSRRQSDKVGTEQAAHAAASRSEPRETIAGLRQAVAEAHHRTKNTLQNVISYINVMFERRDVISRADIHKLVSYVQTLTSLQDIIIRQFESDGEYSNLQLDLVLKDVIELSVVKGEKRSEIRCDSIPRIYSSARIAATTSLILTELLDNALRHGNGNVTFEVEEESPGFVSISISNSLATPAQIVRGNGLRLVEVLARADLGSETLVEQSSHKLVVSFRVPVQFS